MGSFVFVSQRSLYICLLPSIRPPTPSLISRFSQGYSGSGYSKMLINATLPEQRSVSKGAFSKHSYQLSVALHPPSAFDTPNRIIADFKVFTGLLRQRLRWRMFAKAALPEQRGS
jgi:hypothetical protein